MSVTENIAKVIKAKEAIMAHCMCARFVEEGRHYAVYYPEGFFPAGVRAHKGMGKAAALGRMLEVMERHYKENSI